MSNVYDFDVVCVVFLWYNSYGSTSHETLLFLICYTALLVYRLLECRPEDQGSHITTSDLIKTLKNMDVQNVQDIEYMALYTGSDALNALTELTGMGLDFIHCRPKDLNKKIKKILR